MRFLFKSFFILALSFSVSLPVTSAQAEVFMVEDQDDGFTITFPDTWRPIDNQKPDDKLTVAGPGVNNHAFCRVRKREDRRFVIYPQKFDDNIQRLAYSREFWDDYLGEYNDVTVEAFKDNAGLGKGFASMVEASYETAEATVVQKRAVAFATLYHDQVYIVECSAQEAAYDAFRPEFLAIIKSVDFPPLFHEKSHGHYRSFDQDDPVQVEGPKEMDIYKF